MHWIFCSVYLPFQLLSGNFAWYILTVCVTNGLFVYASFQLGLGGQGKDAKASRPNPASQGQGKGLGLKASLVGSQCLCVSLSSPRALKPKEKWSKLAIKPARLALRRVRLDVRPKCPTLGPGFWPSMLSWAKQAGLKASQACWLALISGSLASWLGWPPHRRKNWQTNG